MLTHRQGPGGDRQHIARGGEQDGGTHVAVGGRVDLLAVGGRHACGMPAASNAGLYAM